MPKPVKRPADKKTATRSDPRQADRKDAFNFPDLNPNPVTETDISGHIYYANPAARALFPDLTRMGSAHPWHADWTALISSLPTQSENTICRTLAVDGRHYRQSLKYLPETKRVLIYGMDITDLVEAGEITRAAMSEWEQTFDSIPDLIAIMDTEHRIVRANRALLDRLGMDKEAVIGKYCFTAMHGTLCSPEQCPHRRTLADGREHTAEFRLPQFDGDFLVTTSPLYDIAHTLIGSVHIARDITTHNLAEKALRQSEERHRRLFEQMNEAVALIELVADSRGRAADFRFLEVNPAYEVIVGAERNERIGRLASEIYGTVPYLNEFSRIAKTGKSDTFENFAQHLGKHLRISAASTGPNKLAVIFTDITAQKKSEDAKNNLIAVMSHELRNPLTPILFGAQYLRTRLTEDPGRIDPAVIESVENIETQSKTMARLLDDLLDVSRISRGQITLKRQTVDLRDIIGLALVATDPLISAQGHRLERNIASSAILVNADPVRLEQVLVNLLNNAAKYTSPGGLIRLTLKREGNTALIAIRDNGIGIDPAQTEDIFKLFTRGAKPFASTKGEMGIGLSLTRSLVELQGGKITFKSDGPGKGAEFMVRLPALRYERPIETNAPAEKPEPRRSLKIMIVDDNVDITAIFDRALRLFGHETVVVNDGATALSLIGDFRPQVALIDIGMPGMNGYDVARSLRAIEQKDRLAPIKLIAITGYGQADDKKRVLDAGFDLHLVKPITLDTLERVLNRI